MSDPQVLQDPTPLRTRKRHWLEVAELFSFMGSVVGAVFVLLSGRAAYGVTPLTLALSLNMANRYRQQEQVHLIQGDLVETQFTLEEVEKNAVRAILGMKQHLLAEIAVLQRQLEDIPLEANQRAKQLGVLSETVSAIQDNVAIALEEVRQQVYQEVGGTQDRVEGMGGQIARIEQAIASLQNPKSTPHSPGNLPEEVDVSQMQAQIDHLVQDQQNLIKPNLRRLILTVRQLQTSPSKAAYPLPPKLSQH